jgi:hypothetical protein
MTIKLQYKNCKKKLNHLKILLVYNTNRHIQEYVNLKG